jgi:hypothetical protein
MDLKPVVENLKNQLKASVLEALKPVMKPFLKSFAHSVVAVLKAEAAKTPTPIDDTVLAMVDSKIDELIEKLHLPEVK